MNYLFKELLREVKSQNAQIPQDKLDKIEDITDILTQHEETFETTTLDYDIFPGWCSITMMCPEIVVKDKAEREFYEAVELADKFMCKVNDDVEEDGSLCLTSDMVVLKFTVYFN